MADRPSWRDLAELVRAPAALSVPGDAVAGAAAAGTLRPATLGLIAASVCLYWGGMAANDWADRELDARERPERPIPSGRISPGQAVTVAAGLTAAGLALAVATGGRRAAAFALPLAGAVWAYDLRAKGTRAGPATMAACRGLDVLLGACGGRSAPPGAGGAVASAVPAALTVAAHTYMVTTLSRHEVSGTSRTLPALTLAGTLATAATTTPAPGATRATHQGSATAPEHEVGVAAFLSRWAGVAAGIGRRVGSSGGPGVAGVLAAGYAVRYGAAQVRALVDPSPERVRGAVSAGITQLPLLQGALAARAGAPVAGLSVAAAAFLARRLARKVSPT
ncbi:SCO3242 family prenyltransferase [Nonomuraea jiangxiensis]|uniref:4-hydroxybenzoate polyprenyltransferase n=1 Tax=Nonomuraea jiangxiensis TaxID=633440 RepID=A0A1G8I5B7_9ACTN|nr:UbiA family prenyltransferase [Nonomuraea jiangxiensis]SDI14037.1 4-hydroxybenzoate polyprenyltransferase [Nonomuraea jiangxiensis]